MGPPRHAGRSWTIRLPGLQKVGLVQPPSHTTLDDVFLLSDHPGLGIHRFRPLSGVSAPVATLSEFIDKFLPAPEYRFLNVNPVPRLDTGLVSLLPDHLKPAAGYLRHDRSVGELLNRIKSQFSKLYAGRTNFSLYTAEGMTEEEFEIAESTVEHVCADYAQLYM